MSYDEVPRDGWAEFGDRFGEQHRGWLATLETPDGECVLLDLPLRALVAEADTLTIDCGDLGDHLAHRVCGLQRIEVARTDDDLDEGIRLVTTDGDWSLRFRTAAAPETVDGVYELL